MFQVYFVKCNNPFWTCSLPPNPYLTWLASDKAPTILISSFTFPTGFGRILLVAILIKWNIFSTKQFKFSAEQVTPWKQNPRSWNPATLYRNADVIPCIGKAIDFWANLTRWATSQRYQSDSPMTRKGVLNFLYSQQANTKSRIDLPKAPLDSCHGNTNPFLKMDFVTRLETVHLSVTAAVRKGRERTCTLILSLSWTFRNWFLIPESLEWQSGRRRKVMPENGFLLCLDFEWDAQQLLTSDKLAINSVIISEVYNLRSGQGHSPASQYLLCMFPIQLFVLGVLGVLLLISSSTQMV